MKRLFLGHPVGSHSFIYRGEGSGVIRTATPRVRREICWSERMTPSGRIETRIF